ncbi:MAG TPA: ubiquinol-cytochrome C reductase, partial [Actinomycetota bacterium]|nr:ubiquinol-cytochrome C reductase [Actinomycetota bacterium]
MSGPERAIAVAFTVAIACALGLAVTYLMGGQPQVEGILLAGSLGGIGIGLILWGKRLLPERVVEERLEASAPAVREAAGEAFAGGAREIGRRRLLVRLLLGAVGAMGLAALFPIRSLGPRPGRSLFATGWRPGTRVVDGRGRPVTAEGLVVGSLVTVFPQDAVGSA